MSYEGDYLAKIKINTLPNNGTLKVGGASVSGGDVILESDLNEFIFEPNENWNGTTLFNWVGIDKEGAESEVKEVNITVNTVNDIPVLGSVYFYSNEDVVSIIEADKFTEIITDIESNQITKIKFTSLPNDGTFALDDIEIEVNQEIEINYEGGEPVFNGVMNFIGNSNWNGTNSFIWKAYDSNDYSEAAVGFVIVAGENDPPTITTGTILGDEDQNISLSPSDFENIFTDVDEDSLSLIKIISVLIEVI